jgi:CubicO group peptidase (beta-lactamase class C family)
MKLPTNLLFAPVLLLAFACGCALTKQPTERSSTPAIATGVAPGESRAPAATEERTTAGKTLKLDADTKLQTSSGATLTGAKGWYVTAGKDVLLLEEPDRELSVAIVEVKAPSASTAIESGWKLVQPKFDRKIEHTANPPPREGWDEVVQTTYETTTQESRAVIGIARRKADLWYVSLIDGTKAALCRRGAQLMTTIISLKPKGVEKKSFKGRTAKALDGERIRAFETFVEEARTAAKVPGAAVAVVRDGKVIFEKGFGVRELGKSELVSPRTLFMIGSITKSLTTLLMARLVDEGRLTWTTPMTQLLPSFAIGDADSTRKLTLANTVCACVGLPRQDLEFLFEYAKFTPEMRVAGMRTMKPTTDFGETFQYSNSMVSAGGFAAAHVLNPKGNLGPVYDAAMKSRVFDAMGMKSTTLDFSVAKRMEHASPHGETIKLEYVPIPLSDEEGVVTVRPAGGAWSNVSDMARYVLTELANGKTPEGTRVVSETNLFKRREPQVKITDDLDYGLGLFIENDHDVRIVHHGGNNMGFTSDMFFSPDHGIGAVVLTNAGGANAFCRAVRRKLLEILFDGREEARQNLEFSMKHEQERTAKELEKVVLVPEMTWLSSLVGTYHNDGLGKVWIRTEGKMGIFDAGEWKTTFGKKTEPDGTVKIVLTGASLAGLELVLERKDGRVTLTLDAVQQKYTFEPSS